jgi:dephospho-CoA kinase
MIIGLSGYSRSGKDEVAKILVEDYGFTRIAFADKIRELLYEMNPIVDTHYHLKSLVDESREGRGIT